VEEEEVAVDEMMVEWEVRVPAARALLMLLMPPQSH